MCEQTVSKQQQKQEQTDQARTLIKSKLSKQTVKRRDGNQMQLPTSASLPPSLPRQHSLPVCPLTLPRTVCLCACRFVNKRVRTADCALSRSLVLSLALRMLVFHTEFPKQLPLHARVVVCVDSMWIAGVSLSHRFYE